MPTIGNGLGIGAIALALALMGNAAAAVDKCQLQAGISKQNGRAGPCRFDAQTGSFEGTAAQQAACLTREVQRRGRIGAETITPWLRAHVGTPAPAIAAVQAMLDARQIRAADVGGPLGRPIRADYFIIHDTSTPNCSNDSDPASCPTRGAFPPNRDDASWSVNRTFGGHPKPYPDRAAHVMTNRVGASITEVDFADAIATTKFETCADASVKAKRFVGAENIQPRIGAPAIPAPGVTANDAEAPVPGFTAPQYERLALLYVVASARRGQWLIPAFHAVLDQFYADGHDDPQHFEMTAFSAAVQQLVEANGAALPLQPVSLAVLPAQDEIAKRALPALDARACQAIAAQADRFAAEATSETTQYFTPLFRLGPDGSLSTADRNSCLRMEGSCVAGNVLFVVDDKKLQPFDRDKVKFVFGRGNSGADNKTNALIPCRTLAADQTRYKSGTVIYIPSFKGKFCPQNHEPVDGCFIVGDVGSKIKGQGRFDIFTGECAHPDTRRSVCRDAGNAAFNVPAHTAFRVVLPKDPAAKALRDEVDAVIDNGWKPIPAATGSGGAGASAAQP